MKYENEEELKKTKSLNDLTNLLAKETEDYYPTIDEIKEAAGTTEEEKSIDEVAEVVEEAIMDDNTTKEEVFNQLTSNLHIDTDKIGKKSIIDRFKELDKKKKIIVLSCIGLIVLLIVGLIVYLLIKPKNEEEKPLIDGGEAIVIDNGNYKYIDGTLTFLSESGAEIGKYECNNKDENKCYVAYLSNYEDQFDQNKNLYEDGSFVKFRSNIYNNRYVFLYDNEEEDKEIILYDILEGKVISSYISLKNYLVSDKNYVVLKNTDNSYGLYSFSDNGIDNLIESQYSYMAMSGKGDSKLVVRSGKGYYIVSSNDKKLSKYYKDVIVDYSDDYVVTKNDTGYSIYNENEDLILDNATYIRIIDKYFGIVIDNYLYVRDSKNNKYNEVGYKLYNDYYITNNYYNSEGLLTKSDYSFKCNYNAESDTIFVTVKNYNELTENTLDLIYGKASENSGYVSYFDGILYFYGDSEKNDLLGKYECTNKYNLVNRDGSIISDNGNYCNFGINTFIEKNFRDYYDDEHDILSYIIGNRYVFIIDEFFDENNENQDYDIKLYDLKENKKVATYKMVSTNVKSDGNITFKDSINNIIVKNKDNKYGMLSINANGINKIYDFKYDYMERLGDTILINEKNQYKLLFKDGSISLEYNYKIVDYNNKRDVVLYDGNRFILYSGDSKKVDKKIDGDFKMIKMLSDKYYIYIDENNHLKAKTFKGESLKIEGREEYNMTDTYNIFDYYKRYNVTLVGSKIVVNIFNADGSRKDTINFYENVSNNMPTDNGDNNETEE